MTEADKSEGHRKANQDVEEFLDDDKIKNKLIHASLHLSLFEIVNYQIINKPKLFFSRDTKIINGELIACDETEEYIKEIKSNYKKDLFRASAIWYLKNQVISEAELDMLIRLRNNRNKVAHELFNILLSSSHGNYRGELPEIRGIYRKICLWWFEEIETTVNPAFENIDRSTYDFEKGIETQLFLIDRFIRLIQETN